MNLLIQFLITLIAVEHQNILRPGLFSPENQVEFPFQKTFPDELSLMSSKLKGVEGLFNGFLSLGLAWSFFITDEYWKGNIAKFFLGCIIITGIYGTAYLNRKLFFLQSLPALITLGLLLWTPYST